MHGTAQSKEGTTQICPAVYLGVMAANTPFVRRSLYMRVQVMAIAQLIESDFSGQRDLSGIGGVETGRDAAEFLLLGANSVQARLLAACQCAIVHA